jgi:hypothetical protein
MGDPFKKDDSRRDAEFFSDKRERRYLDLSGRALPGQAISNQLRSLRLKKNSAPLREKPLAKTKKPSADFREGFGQGVVRELRDWYTRTESVVKQLFP